MNRAKVVLSGLLCLGLVAGLAFSSIPALAQSELPSVSTDFAPYELVPLLGDETPYAGPATPTSLDGVAMTEQVDGLLTPEARAKLAEQGFVIVPEEFRLFHHAYDEQYYDGHAGLRDHRRRLSRLAPGLRQDAARPRERSSSRRRWASSSSGMRAQRRRAARGPRRHARWRMMPRASSTCVSVAAAELGLKAGKLSERAQAEKALIDEHEQSVESPILGTVTDYSLFTPRGHYTRSEALTRYFVAMSVLGQTAFRLPGSVQTDETTVQDPDNLRLALLASRTLVGDAELEALWRQVFEPTAFLVGVSDDYTPFELAAAVEATVAGRHGRPADRDRRRDALRRRGGAHDHPARADRPRAALGAPDGHPLRHRFVDPRPARATLRGHARRAARAGLAAGHRRGLRLRRRPGHPGRGRRDRLSQLPRADGRPCARPWRPVPTRPGARPSTTPGWPRWSRCGCPTVRPSPTSCGPMPGMPRPSRPASAPMPSSSTTPSSTPSRPSARSVRSNRSCRPCATGSSPTRCPSSASRPWPC